MAKERVFHCHTRHYKPQIYLFYLHAPSSGIVVPTGRFKTVYSDSYLHCGDISIFEFFKKKGLTMALCRSTAGIDTNILVVVTLRTAPQLSIGSNLSSKDQLEAEIWPFS
jgi:hypothetical protein